MRSNNNKTIVAALSSSLFLCVAEPVAGEVVFDGSLGPMGSLSGNMVIEDTFGQQVGSNLFHSFLTFNVNLGETATFTAASLAPIDNVISRVTGGSLSSINGELGSTIPGASLWLINPSGIAFGENASLNVSGSFHATTADYLTLADGGQFGADLSIAANTTLTIADPASFGFLDSNIAPLTIQESVLQVNNGESLALVGGDIQITGGLAGFLNAPAGSIDLVSVASAGDVVWDSADPSTAIDVDDFDALGSITLSNLALLNVSTPGLDSGIIFIRGGSLSVENSFMVADDGSSLFGFFQGTERGGLVDIEASDDVTLDGSFISVQASSAGTLSIGSNSLTIDGTFILADTYGFEDAAPTAVDIETTGAVSIINGSVVSSRAFAVGDGGDVSLQVGSLNIDTAGTITMRTFGAGTAGDVRIASGGPIVISGFPSGIDSRTFGNGLGGDVHITASTLSVDDATIEGGVGQGATGAAGEVRVELTDSLTLTSGAQISATTNGSGRGGDLMITAGDIVSLSGRDASGAFLSGLISNSTASGDSGNITVNTRSLSMDDALIQVLADSLGDAGNVDINVDTMNLENGSQISARTFSFGNSGIITIDAAESVSISGSNPPGTPGDFRSGLFSRASVGGSGGIFVTTPLLELSDLGEISTTSNGPGMAGAIDIDAGSLIVDNSGLLSASTLGDGDGGSINITADSLLLASGGAISSDTFGNGEGGTININAVDSLQMTGQAGTNTGIFSEAFAAGDAGSILISASNIGLFSASAIATASAQSAGGSINIQATDLMHVVDSRITSEANGVTPTDSGGNINIRRPEFLVLNVSEVRASANAGNGGNILIDTGAFVASSDSIVNASSNTGVDGVIAIESPNDVTGTVVALTADIFFVDELMTDQCSPRAIRERSTFTLEGGGVNPGPDAYLSASIPIAAANAAQAEGYIDARPAELFVTAQQVDCSR
jgi:filamentous hemagglutinin family protein